MDFIEDHIVRNGFISEQQKLNLIYSPEMAPYSFVGALIHYSMLPEPYAEIQVSMEEGMPERREGVVSDFDRQENECEDDIELEELLDLYNNLTIRDVKSIT